MHLLQVVPYFAPAWAYGGPPKVMWEEARALVSRGHDVEVFTTDALDERERSKVPSPSIEEGVVVHRFENVSNWLAFNHYRFTPRGLVSMLRETSPDAIHLSEVRHELAIAAWWRARTADIPLVVSAHGTLPQRDGPKATLRRLYDRRWVDPMVKGAAALLAQTAHEADLYRAVGASDSTVHVLPLGVDPPPPGDDLSIALGPPEGAPFILFLGRIHELKGVVRLIEAFARLGAAAKDHHLVIAGRDDGALGTAQARVQALGVGDRVHFPGPIYGDARFAAYRQASLFAIVPTHFEETSLASLEAAAVGTPVFVSEEADLPFLAEYGGGTVVRRGDDLVGRLDDAIGGDLVRQGELAAKMVAERHLWPVVALRLEEILIEATT